MENTVQGKIIKGLGGLYEIRVADHTGVHRLSCRAKGAFRHEDTKVTVGDEVIVRYDDADPENTAVIREILPRKNCLIRPPVSNLDYLFCVMAAAKPAPVLTTIDKLIAIATHNDITPVVIVTKSDFDASESRRYTELYRSVGIPVFCTSGEIGEGIDELRSYLEAHVRNGASAAFAGASGVGKSTLLNRLFPELGLATGDISARIERGKHTTRHVELYEVHGEGTSCGYLADTPGFSMLDFMHFDFFSLEDLFDAFPEFVPHRGACRYADCSHTGERPEECAIARAVKDGTIAASRHESYRELWRTLKAKKNTYK